MTALLAWWAVSVVAVRLVYAGEHRRLHREIKRVKYFTEDDAPYACPRCGRLF